MLSIRQSNRARAYQKKAGCGAMMAAVRSIHEALVSNRKSRMEMPIKRWSHPMRPVKYEIHEVMAGLVAEGT